LRAARFDRIVPESSTSDRHPKKQKELIEHSGGLLEALLPSVSLARGSQPRSETKIAILP
jgi:hypothetical protein